VTANLDERIEVVKSKVAAARYLHDRIRKLATGGSYSPPTFVGVSPVILRVGRCGFTVLETSA
jgi:hypothetical protein